VLRAATFTFLSRLFIAFTSRFGYATAMRGVPFPMSRRRFLLLFVAALALTGIAPAQYTGYSPQRGMQRQQQAQTGTITMSGVVVNSVTGEPVPRALVQMNGMVSRVALTDAEGRFQFDNLPETQAVLIAHKPGYFSEMELRQNMG